MILCPPSNGSRPRCHRPHCWSRSSLSSSRRRIYVQAKRYALDTSVGRPDIQAFVGALHGNQANRGVFITSGRFSQSARDYSANLPTRVILIDGQRLTSLMIRYGVGVQVKRTVQIVEEDEDFFE